MPLSVLENRNILRASLKILVVANALKGRRGRGRQIRVQGLSGFQSKFLDYQVYAEKQYLKKKKKFKHLTT